MGSWWDADDEDVIADLRHGHKAKKTPEPKPGCFRVATRAAHHLAYAAAYAVGAYGLGYAIGVWTQ